MQTICPHCQKEFELTEALTQHLEEQVRHSEHQKYTLQLEKQKNEFRQAFDKKIAEEQTKARQKAVQEFQLNLQTSQEALSDEKQRNQQLLEQLTGLNKQLRDLHTKDEQRQLEMEKTLLAEQDKIRQEARVSADEEHHLKQRELEKKLQDISRVNEDLRRKLEQGSQQTQGEVLELAIEQLLANQFPHDQVTEVPKGVTGADVIQVVCDESGRVAGSIIWEVKNTKAFSPSWITKLKDDQRTLKSEFAVLVSTALPEQIKHFGHRDGVWVSSHNLVVPVATTLRNQLLSLASIKRSQDGQTDKMSLIYQYVSSTEFKHRIESMVEAFSGLQVEIEKEKRLFAQKWARQEKYLRQVLDNTHGMYGDFQGIMGNELSALESEEELLLEGGKE